jgi:hypothetical protein
LQDYGRPQADKSTLSISNQDAPFVHEGTHALSTSRGFHQPSFEHTQDPEISPLLSHPLSIFLPYINKTYERKPKKQV